MSVRRSNQSNLQNKGYQPRPSAPVSTPPKPDAGYQPSTGQGAPANPPDQGGSGKK